MGYRDNDDSPKSQARSNQAECQKFAGDESRGADAVSLDHRHGQCLVCGMIGHDDVPPKGIITVRVYRNSPQLYLGTTSERKAWLFWFR